MSLYNQYKQKQIKATDLIRATAILHWDQETHMPEGGAQLRARQLSTLTGIMHELATEKEMGEILEKLKNDDSLSAVEKKNVALSYDDYIKQKKYPVEFVMEMSKTFSESLQAWRKAKQENKFSIFSPYLEKIVIIKKKEADILGYKKHPYDALLDNYEPGCTTELLDNLFGGVRNKLVDFVKIIAAAKQVNNNFMYQSYNADKQWDFGMFLLKQMNYDFNYGRQDKSTHPFTISFGPQDVRVTTRIDENNLNEMIWSTIHEGGHALYEQGLLMENYGLPAGYASSLSIHESQSRLWENNVGRSLPYWKCNYSRLQQLFPENLKNVSAKEFYRAMNTVNPSFVRTNADELTYHFHVMIRFEAEKLLIEEKLSVKDLPEYWNSKYKEYLGIDVPDDANGVLQDIHWSHGSIGYFPTYSLGSFYAAQFFESAKKQIPNLENEIESGNLLPLLNWLRDNIHKHGRLYNAEELCERITGEKLNFNYFMNYAEKKYSDIYSLSDVNSTQVQ
jgi:carboxypeptidase Taq